MELLRTPRLLLRHWEESDLPAFYDLYSRDDVMRWLGSHPRRTLTTLDEARERLAPAPAPPGAGVCWQSDEGTTDRWFGLTARQFRKVISSRCQPATPGPGRLPRSGL